MNAAVFDAHGPDYRKRGGATGIVVDPLFQYERLLQGLTEVPALHCLPFRELLSEPCPPDRVCCGIRHDVDVDIRTALSQAELEWTYGVRTTYFILHTAPYYGSFRDGVFCRNNSMAHVYRRLQEFGHEIALHTDPFFIYQSHQIDGAEAIVCELQWLRSEGLTIVGTTAHNSAAVYGVESYAVFKGRPRSLLLRAGPSVDSHNPVRQAKEIIHNGKWAPLEVLDEKELGLAYEANDIFWREENPVANGAILDANTWRWIRDHVRWWETKDPSQLLTYDQDQLLRDIGALDPGRFLILVVHPVYYGARHAADTGPALSIDHRSTLLNEMLGWETYHPLKIQARSGKCHGRQEFQAINMANEFGMLDVPTTSGKDKNELRIIMFGGVNLDGSSVAIPTQMPVLLATLLRDRIQRPVKIWKLAYPGMGLTRHFGWYMMVKKEIMPHVVMLSLGADEVVTSLPEYWAVRTGFNARYPPGHYLHWNGQDVTVVPRMPGAFIRRGNPRPTIGPVSFAHSPSRWNGLVTRTYAECYIRACLKHFATVVRHDGAIPLVMLQECGENIGLWSENSTPQERHLGHVEFAEWAYKVGSEATVPIVDPYSIFLEQPPDLLSHWVTGPEWNFTGHRLSAQAALTVLLSCLRFPDQGVESR